VPSACHRASATRFGPLRWLVRSCVSRLPRVRGRRTATHELLPLVWALKSASHAHLTYARGPGSDSCRAAMVGPVEDGEDRARSHRAPLLPRDSRHRLPSRGLAEPTGCPVFALALGRAVSAHASPGHFAITMPPSRSHPGKIQYHPQRRLLLAERLRAVSAPDNHYSTAYRHADRSS
jgi:hypothetical protein